MEKGGIQTAQPRLLEDGIRGVRTEIQCSTRRTWAWAQEPELRLISHHHARFIAT